MQVSNNAIVNFPPFGHLRIYWFINTKISTLGPLEDTFDDRVILGIAQDTLQLKYYILKFM